MTARSPLDPDASPGASRRPALDSPLLLVRAAILALVLWGPIYSLVFFHQGLPLQGFTVLAGAGILIVAALVQRGRESTILTGNLVAGSLFVVATSLALEAEGLLSPALNWYVLVPILATILASWRWGLAWGVLGVAVLVGLFVTEQPIPRIPQENQEVLVVWAQSGLVIFGLCFALLYDVFRHRAMATLEDRNRDLSRALEEVQRLQAILPICMHCRKVRDENSRWQALEEYLDSHSSLEFSHGLCADCLHEHYPEIGDEDAAEPTPHDAAL